MATPKKYQGHLNAQTQDDLIQRYLNKVQWSGDTQQNISQLRRLAKELDKDLQQYKDIDSEIKSVTGKVYTPQDVRTARKWFRDEIKDIMSNPWGLHNMVPDKLKLRWYSRGNKAMGNKPSPHDIGRMFYYGYNPKTKDILPYYDIFPLILLVRGVEGGWYGLNLHYLPPKQREILILRLMENMNNKKYDETSKIKMNYKLLSTTAKYRYFKPCFKRYLASHTKTSVRPVPFKYWPRAILLPVANFKKASITSVWADSLKISRGI